MNIITTERVNSPLQTVSISISRISDYGGFYMNPSIPTIYVCNFQLKLEGVQPCAASNQRSPNPYIRSNPHRKSRICDLHFATPVRKVSFWWEFWLRKTKQSSIFIKSQIKLLDDNNSINVNFQRDIKHLSPLDGND